MGREERNSTKLVLSIYFWVQIGSNHQNSIFIDFSINFTSFKTNTSKYVKNECKSTSLAHVYRIPNHRPNTTRNLGITDGKF
jgi:hypothetical protein